MNKTVPLRGFGGGGVLLNFDVVVGTTEPTNPKENTIWLNTDRKINGYSFSATQPESMAEGEVWFSVGASSDVAFSATKKNSVMVYPISAKQKIDGVLVDKPAKSYQNGEWVDWIKLLYIFKTGEGLLLACKNSGGVASSVTVSNEKLTISYSGGQGIHTIYEITEKIDVTDYKKLCLEANFTAASNASMLYIGTKGYAESGYATPSAQVSLTANRTKTMYALDISSFSGEYIVGFYGDLMGEVYNWYLEG